VPPPVCLCPLDSIMPCRLHSDIKMPSSFSALLRSEAFTLMVINLNSPSWFIIISPTCLFVFISSSCLLLNWFYYAVPMLTPSSTNSFLCFSLQPFSLSYAFRLALRLKSSLKSCIEDSTNRQSLILFGTSHELTAVSQINLEDDPQFIFYIY